MTSAVLDRYAHEVPRPTPRPRALPAPDGSDVTADILKQLGLAVLVVDAEDHITYANDWACDQLGHDLVNTPFADLWSEDAGDVQLMLSAVAAAPGWRNFKLRPKRASAGDAAAVTLRGRPIVLNRPPVLPSRHILITSDALSSAADLVVPEPQRPGALEDGHSAGEVDAQRELIHRVKNNLALLMSLVRTARRNVNDQSADEEISGLERRLMSISAMHDVLDAHRETASLRADDLLRRVCEGLTDALAPAGVAITCALEPLEVPVALGSPIALIVNELLTNALKHGYPDGRHGEVQVALHLRDDGLHEICVRDDGVGKAGAKAARRGSHGSGGGIVRALVMQLGGTLEALEQDAGTGWALRFSA